MGVEEKRESALEEAMEEEEWAPGQVVRKVPRVAIAKRDNGQGRSKGLSSSCAGMLRSMTGIAIYRTNSRQALSSDRTNSASPLKAMFTRLW